MTIADEQFAFDYFFWIIIDVEHFDKRLKSFAVTERDQTKNHVNEIGFFDEKREIQFKLPTFLEPKDISFTNVQNAYKTIQTLNCTKYFCRRFSFSFFICFFFMYNTVFTISWKLSVKCLNYWYWRHYPSYSIFFFVFVLSFSVTILQLTIHYNFISVLFHTMMTPQNLLKCKICTCKKKMVHGKWGIVPSVSKLKQPWMLVDVSEPNCDYWLGLLVKLNRSHFCSLCNVMFTLGGHHEKPKACLQNCINVTRKK